MDLNFTHCYRAVQARDHRYDGLFFTAVRTTGIYCRCICPARTPKPTSVTFFRTATEAEDQGFRPCLRCRPETAPGSPAWVGTSTTVQRAMRLIEQGHFFEDSLDAFCDRLGISSRHLNRLFNDHIGISAGAFSRTKRIQTAKSLLDQTALPVTDIALATGFKSIRRFNDAFKHTYGTAPRSMRRNSSKTPGKDGLVRLRVAYREPFSWSYFVSYMSARSVRGVESINEKEFQRTFSLDGKPLWVTVAPDKEARHLTITFPIAALHHTLAITEKVRDLFDLRCDAEAVRARLAVDPFMKGLLRRKVLPRVPGCWDPFELGVRTIIGQQVSVAAATTITTRVAERVGTLIPGAPVGANLLFPSPAALIEANLDGTGLPGRRIEALKAFARAVDEGALFEPGIDRDEFRKRMLNIPGIGAWTAEYLAMRALRDPDAFPASDLGILKALSPGQERLIKPRAAQDRADAWRPWRAYAVYLLWLSLTKD